MFWCLFVGCKVTPDTLKEKPPDPQRGREQKKRNYEFSTLKHYIMKKLFLLLSLLPLWGHGGCSLFAAVEVNSISADYSTGKVTFSVSWAAGSRNATHLSKIWVFVDYQPVSDPTTKGAWTRAALAGVPTVSGVGTASTVTGNTQGFWLDASDAGTAAYSATVTVTLKDMPAKFNWCAYATDYPPNLQFTGLNTYQLHGSAPFTLVDTGAATTTVANGNVQTNSGSKIFATLTDRTSCPGIINCTPSTAATVTCLGSTPALVVQYVVNE